MIKSGLRRYRLKFNTFETDVVDTGSVNSVTSLSINKYYHHLCHIMLLIQCNKPVAHIENTDWFTDSKSRFWTSLFNHCKYGSSYISMPLKEVWARWLSVVPFSPWWHPSGLTSRCWRCPGSCWLCISLQWPTRCSSSKTWQTEATQSSQQSQPWCKRWRSCGGKRSKSVSIWTLTCWIMIHYDNVLKSEI